jgi:hypothetical protein
MLIGIKKSVCEQINSKLGISSVIPNVAGVFDSEDVMNNWDNYYFDNNYILPSSEYIIGAGASDAVLQGKAEGCFYESEGGGYVYFSVISER